MSFTAPPTFSICVPNYNYGHLINETIESVLAQTYGKFELIIVDNASTDNSLEVIKQYKDPRIRVYRNQYNIGFAPNLQRVTQYAQNEFINLLSSDDLMMPDALQTYADIIMEMPENRERLVLFSQAEGFDNSGVDHLHYL